MIFPAGVLLVLLSAAYADSPRSPVLAALSPSSTGASLVEVIKAMNASERNHALAALDRLDRAALVPETTTELAHAYRLLGRPDAALDGAVSRDGEAKAIFALAEAGDYASAQAAAEKALKRFPGNKNLLALLHQVKGRTAGRFSSTPAAARSKSPTATAQETDSRPSVLQIKAGKSAPPPEPDASTAYLNPGVEKASQGALIWSALWNLGRYKVDYESSAELERMATLRAKLDQSETGRTLVADLGGWDKIQRDVDIRFAGVWGGGMNAYFRPFDAPDSKGRRGALVINKDLINEPDAVAVPILAHELSHARDYQGDHGLAIPSEFAAHRTQIQVFEEMKAKMTPTELARLGTNERAQYQSFIALLWEDHLVQRFKSGKEMAAAVGAGAKIEKIAAEVLRDLKNGTVAPGGPQLDHHLNGEVGGLYRHLTDEKDIVDLIREREASGAYDANQRSLDRKTMTKRAALLAQSEKQDAQFRTKHGFQIEAGK